MAVLALTALMVMPGAAYSPPAPDGSPHDPVVRAPVVTDRDSPAPPPDRPPVEWDAEDGVEFWRHVVAEHFGPNTNRALAVMGCESGGNPNAKNPSSSASGLFQHLATYWPERSAQAGLPGASIWSPTANIAVAAWLSDGGSDWSHWVCKG